MPEFAESTIEWLALPPRDYSGYSRGLQYGAGKIAAEYCRLHVIPRQIRGHWQHGWVPEFLAVDPRLVANQAVQYPKHCWVARKDQEAYLQKHGFNARAIGLPIAYVPDVSHVRKPNSLLVMPAHSLDPTTHTWGFADYAEAIERIRSEFDVAVACVHPACAKKKYWVKEFQQLGIPIILGAELTDRNSLVRIKSLMSQFEFVTTNTCGSSIAYACAFGAKLSIYGPYCEYRVEDFARDRFFGENPGLLEKVLSLLTESAVRTHFPSLFCHPKEAVLRTEWGLHQIGFSNRISAKEMKQLFNWGDFRQGIKKTGSMAIDMVRQIVPQPIKRPARALLRRSKLAIGKGQ